MFSRWSRGIKSLPASEAEANLGREAVDRAVPTVHCVLAQGSCKVPVTSQETFCVWHVVASPLLEPTGPLVLTTLRYGEQWTDLFLLVSTFMIRGPATNGNIHVPYSYMSPLLGLEEPSSLCSGLSGEAKGLIPFSWSSVALGLLSSPHPSTPMGGFINVQP